MVGMAKQAVNRAYETTLQEGCLSNSIAVKKLSQKKSLKCTGLLYERRMFHATFATVFFIFFIF